MNDALLYAKIEQLDAEMAETPLILRPLDIYHALIGKEERDEEIAARRVIHDKETGCSACMITCV